MGHRRDGIIYLHGIGRSGSCMASLEREARSHDFRTLIIDYPARRHDLSSLADYVEKVAAPWIDALEGSLHLVTHSMGGLVARAWLTRYRRAKLGRVVMLAPPSQGSEIADLLAPTGVFRAVYGPAGMQLTTRQSAALVALLGRVDYPLGIIAGRRSFDPLGWLVLPKPNDGRVSVERTKLEGMADHIILPVTHTFLTHDPIVIEQTYAFLMEGRFRRV